MGKKLACRFVGYGEKTEKSPYSSAPSRPLGTICSLMKLTLGYAHCSGRCQPDAASRDGTISGR
ncbi:hypothetical protein CCGE531_24525 (plasmid) [Rhizobium sp. CCGE531]|nr:hypothetical protein CCGE531_24525 [Rhizobium sp. CCGE531]AYG75586.1 hypothetical protein CCGE532_24030 [Rhizobium sp. CCGE532]